MSLKSDYKVFQEEIGKRDIKYLIHFTPTINLLSIFEQNKILLRKLLEENNIENRLDSIEFTDDIRFDDKSYINLSVQRPNSFLFSKFREKTSEKSYISWCVLKIDKKYIYYSDTLFSITNAANSYNRKNVGITGDIDKFRMMFAPSLKVVRSYGEKNISRKNLEPQYPTDEQAEVLVKDEILLSDILQVCFRNKDELAETKAALSGYKTDNFVVDASLFSANFKI